MSSAPTIRDSFARTYRPILERGLQRVISEEVKAIKQAIEAESRAGFGDVYNELVPRLLRSRVRPVQFSYGKDLVRATSKETSIDFDPEDGALVMFTMAYSNVFSKRYIGSHAGQLHALKTMDEVQQRLDEWTLKEAGKRGRNEITRQSQATFRQCLFSRNLSIVWRTRGKSCDYCNQLDGTTISKKNPFFVPKMGVVDPGVEGKKPMTVYRGCGHPPLHPG